MGTYEDFLETQFEKLRHEQEQAARDIDNDPYFLGFDISDGPELDFLPEHDAELDDWDSEAYEHILG